MSALGGRVAPAQQHLQATLTGSRGVAAVRNVAVEGFTHGIADRLEDARTWRQERLTLLRTKFKPDRKLTAYYLYVPPETGAPGLPIAATWWIDGRTDVHVSPADPSMPQLRSLADPDRLSALITALGQPAPDPTRMRIWSVRYRPGQRHVLHAHAPGGGPGCFLKTDRNDSGAMAVAVAGAVADTVRQTTSAVSVVEPLGHLGPEKASVWREAAGVRLASRLSSRRTASTAVRHVGRALRALHELEPASLAADARLPAALPAHDTLAETTATLRAGEHIRALVPGLGARYEELAGRIFDALQQQPGEAAVLCHGDLKCDNLLVAGDQVRILDLDRVSVADPALDLGKFLADLRWWCSEAKQCAELESAFRAGYGECDPMRLARADLLAPLFQLKLAARRCAVHDVRWETLVRARMSQAAGSFRAARGA